jgi:hypothetical protein
MNPPTTSKFNISEAGAVYNYSDKCMYLTKTKAKTSPGQVEFRKLSEKHKNIFRQARAKEVKLGGVEAVSSRTSQPRADLALCGPLEAYRCFWSST